MQAEKRCTSDKHRTPGVYDRHDHTRTVPGRSRPSRLVTAASIAEASSIG